MWPETTDTAPNSPIARALHSSTPYSRALGAFATATVLAGLALITLLIKSLLEWRFADELAATRRH